MTEQKTPDEVSQHDGGHDGHSENSHGHTPQMSRLLIPVALAILVLLGFYGYLVKINMPQDWTKTAISGHHEAGDHHDATGHDAAAPEAKEPVTPEPEGTATPTPEGTTPKPEETATKLEGADHPDHDHDAHAGHDHADHAKGHDDGHGKNMEKHHPPYFMITPFAILLLCIAVFPLLRATEHWWESNTNRFLVASVLGFITLLYYYLFCDFPVELHWPGHAVVDPKEGGLAVASAIFTNAIIGEYIPFIVLLFSLFTISGGIRISGDLKATPFVNSVILLIGAAIASIVGTTGAAMLLIRLLLETNQERKHKVHTIVFFIFCVCNCGGCLTPLGDPPLFLGYLRGVAFTWTLELWKEWAFLNLILISMYFLWDTIWFYPRESKADKARDAAEKTALSIKGWKLNVPLLAGVVAAVAFLDPSKSVPMASSLNLFPENNGHPWFFLREAVQLGLCAISLLFGSRVIRKANTFNFLAIGEVAALFFGIFICMQAPLQILNVEGENIVAQVEKQTGIDKSKLFFWSTGTLSSVLDNAPTYVVFFETAKALTPNTEAELAKDETYGKNEKGKWVDKSNHDDVLVTVTGGFIGHHLLIAVSLGAVFMGAMTYIGNGPNFMVKAIAEQSGVKMPSFFGYMLYSCLILLPVLVLMTLIFL